MQNEAELKKELDETLKKLKSSSAASVDEVLALLEKLQHYVEEQKKLKKKNSQRD